MFEVLISILVASIGVTGVLVLIPFAVRSAQIGMDREAAINTSKNFFADFQAYGYHDATTWMDDDQAVHLSNTYFSLPYGPPPPPAANNIRPGWPYLIDPIGAATFGVGNYGQMPNYASTLWGGPPYDDFPALNRVTLNKDPNTAPLLPIELGLARRLAMPQDLLVFDAPATELGPPVQRYFTLDSVAGVKRQYNGNRSSAVTVVVPMTDDGSKYRVYVLALGTGDRVAIRTFAHEPTTAINKTAGPRGFQGIALGGGDLRLRELPPSLPIPPEQPENIRNNDWVMLINLFRQHDGIDQANYDDIQLGFYRVIHSMTDEADTSVQHVTLQGADFDLFPDWNEQPDGTPTPNNATTGVNTYAVLIPNVLAVYERTIRTEPDSTWVVE